MNKLVLGLTLASLSAAANMATANNLCLLSGTPGPEHGYDEIKRVKVAKRGYGSVNEMIPQLLNKARGLGADAVINYNGSQRFGFWPWQFVRPTATGTAIKWKQAANVDCESMGGTYKTQLNGPLTTDV
ncbi:hypothetical protein [Pseudomaricurvus sp. HS19]|uniref:hypothetical protein n=1 Tax=Pseudomaricurvus sp. HS19 TaxID=2692626 RepID=UPI001368148A|nr:hypothetical protein [Pseudomaricurvus sp. HS19]MYM62942.1 hypothetical protein [Pseudomaricurvus sp. HS19]